MEHSVEKDPLEKDLRSTTSTVTDIQDEVFTDDS